MAFKFEEPKTETELLEEVAGRADGMKYTWSEKDKAEMIETAKGIVEVVRRYDAKSDPRLSTEQG
jgi:3-deoxy-D-arabino-heptulosonate 7-phosphate (DAHP) synthase class II